MNSEAGDGEPGESTETDPARFVFDGPPLGEGGFGIVYRAQRVDAAGYPIEGDLALKQLQARWCGTQEAVDRFKLEARIQSEDLDHPNVMPVVGRNLSDNPPYFVMPLASHSLKDELSDGLNDDRARSLEVFELILEAMSHAHDRNILHRDLKPANVLFVEGDPRVADFGFGKRMNPDATDLTATEAWFGTERYMAPEQRSASRDVDERADVYSLGKILAELLTGNKPEPYVFDSSTVPSEYQYICARCCDQNAENRFRDASELLKVFRLTGGAVEIQDPPIEGAEKLIAEWMTGSQTAETLDSIFSHFRRYANEEELYTRILPELPDILLTEMLTESPAQARELFSVYGRHVSGPLGFTYCDVLADFFSRIFLESDDLELKRQVFSRLWELGPTHNRWHVGQALARVVENVSQTSDILLIVEIVGRHPERAEWNDFYLTQVPIAAPIRAALDEAIAGGA